MARSKNLASRKAELETVAEIMTLAIAREKASADYYDLALHKATTDSARRAFALMLEQEREHENRLREELTKLRKEMSGL